MIAYSKEEWRAIVYRYFNRTAQFHPGEYTIHDWMDPSPRPESVSPTDREVLAHGRTAAGHWFRVEQSGTDGEVPK